MLYRSVGPELTIEEEITDPKKTLERVWNELTSHALNKPSDFFIDPSLKKKTRVKLRPAIKITFRTTKEADAAEAWIDANFEL